MKSSLKLDTNLQKKGDFLAVEAKKKKNTAKKYSEQLSTGGGGGVVSTFKDGHNF